MAVVVVTPASSYQLTTLAVLKDELGITVSTYDTQLGRAIDRASEIVTQLCGRVFTRELVAESLPGNGAFNMLLSRFPLVSVTSVYFDGNLLTTEDYSLSEPSAGVLYFPFRTKETARGYHGIGRMPIQSSRENMYVVTYTGGYITPAISGTRDLPFAIEQATLEIAKTLYQKQKNGIQDKQSESVPEVYSVTYAATAMGASRFSAVAALLEPYKLREMV